MVLEPDYELLGDSLRQLAAMANLGLFLQIGVSKLPGQPTLSEPKRPHQINMPARTGDLPQWLVRNFHPSRAHGRASVVTGASLEIVEPPEKQATEQQNQMETEGRVFLIGQARVRSLWVKSLKNTVYEVLPLVAPLVQIHAQEGRLKVSQRLSPGFTLLLSTWSVGFGVCIPTHHFVRAFASSHLTDLASACPTLTRAGPWRTGPMMS